MNTLKSVFWFLKYPLLVMIAAVAAVGVVGGSKQAVVVATLVILEVSLSFDNAVINAIVLRRLNFFWQKIFMTVGMVVAVVGMRLFFPVAIVVATSGLSFGSVTDLILHQPLEYGLRLEQAHPVIAAFGGIFLLMIFLDFVLDEGKKIHWIAVVERPLAKVGQLKALSTLIALVALLIVALTWGHTEPARVILAGITGLSTYLAVRGFSQLFEKMGGIKPEAGPGGRLGAGLGGRTAFWLFVYLEVLDASFSFDGVVGAFAITNNVLSIVIGLGVGAYFVRQLTLWLVRNDTLQQFIYLEHGAHYAVGALAVLLGASLQYKIPDLITGLVGVLFIGLALASSFWSEAKA